ncbi:YitT family protein [Nocardia sp. NPDC088792]|uniref:membrane protein YczE n=1 Tax=Nocardia sp. NPDC088792 TaxID=3364332 RepID=UPI0037FFB81B
MLVRRLLALYAGLWLYGFSMAVMIRAAMGLDPWDVFHQGVANHVPLSFGTITAITGAAVLLAWIPLRQWPGLGTISNVFVIAVSVDAGLNWLPQLHGLPLRVGAMLGAVVLNAIASVLYIGAGFGPGPRDGLMTGLVRRTGRPVWLIRTGIEVTVLTTGFLLGGSVGVGTVLYALGIGPLIHLLIPLVHDYLPGFHTVHRAAESEPGRVEDRNALWELPITESDATR